MTTCSKTKPEKILYFTKSTLLTRGWNQKLIDKLLSPPKLVENPHYKKAALMRLFVQEEVFQAEQTEEFLEAKVKKEKRTQAGLLAADKKREKLLELVSGFVFSVRRISMESLKKRTIRSKEDWNEQCYWRPYCDFSKADNDTMQRWMVNYIRHNLTDYEDKLDLIFGKTGKQAAYELTSKLLFQKIAEVYPELQEECELQLLSRISDEQESNHHVSFNSQSRSTDYY